MFEILSRYLSGFSSLTKNINKIQSFKKYLLLLLTLAIYPISLFVIFILFLFSKISILLFKILSR